MKFGVIDFETFYSKDYSLTKMSTEDYVCDPRFEIILVGLQFNGEEKKWFSGHKKAIAAWLDAEGVWDAAMVAHNGIFDFLIMAVHFGKLPKLMFCTRMMAYATVRPHVTTVSLKNCLEQLNSPHRKGDEVYNMIGRTKDSLNEKEMVRYAIYCMDDCEGTLWLFNRLRRYLPPDELLIIDMTLRMYLEPQFQLDPKVLAQNLHDVRVKKETLLSQVPASITKDQLSSNPKFAAVLQALGVEVPMKASPTTGEPTYAFAKTDTGWKELEDEYADDPVVSAVLAARLGVKSTIEETRSVRLMNIAQMRKWFRIPLMYYAAHTGRYGGTEGINAQNFPRVDKSRMRFGIIAPQDHVVIAADLAQVEARITAWLAGCQPLVDGFANNVDLYSMFAGRVFGKEVKKGRSKEDDKQRFVGKTCILGLGFGMGPPKLQGTLRKDGMKFTLVQTSAMVNLYRSDYWQIPELWRFFDNHIAIMSSGTSQVRKGPLTLSKNAIILPNGLPVQYPKLRLRKFEDPVSGAVKEKWSYIFGREIRPLWGGIATENAVQALARTLVMWHMVRIRREIGLRPALQQHDELDYVVPARDADRYVGEIRQVMTDKPDWASGLPVAVEINYGKTLGDCK